MKSDGTKAKLFRGIHAEGVKRGLDHDALRDVCRERFGVHSMGDLTEAQLYELYFAWTGKRLRRKSKLPRRGYGHGKELEIVSGEDLNLLAEAFAKREWGPETQRNFVRRQLGRDQVRTKADFWKVFSGVRAMNRREQL